VHALKGVDISIKKGEFFGLLGPNGAGKTTTINILTGLVFKNTGITEIFGKDTVRDFRFTRSKIGIAAQELSVDWFFTIEKLLYFQAGYYGIPSIKAKPRIDDLLERLGLSKKRNSRLRQLSGGMKRRFQLAKALVHDPEILILDEPTAGVDVELRRDLWKYLKDLHSNGKTILLTTHYIEEAELLCENIGIIHDGRILKEGSPKSLIQELGTAGVTVHLSNNDINVNPYFKDFFSVIIQLKDDQENKSKISDWLTVSENIILNSSSRKLLQYCEFSSSFLSDKTLRNSKSVMWHVECNTFNFEDDNTLLDDEQLIKIIENKKTEILIIFLSS